MLTFPVPQTYTRPRRASFGALLQLPDFRAKDVGTITFAWLRLFAK